jgi:hypothetical protein
MVIESGDRKGAKLASQECLPREGRAAASYGVGVRLAMEAVVEWAERRKERLEEIRSVVLDCPLARKTA